MNKADVAELVGSALVEAGLVKVGRRSWSLDSGEVAWLLELDAPRRRVSLVLGLSLVQLLDGTRPPSANDQQAVMWLEQLDLAPPTTVWDSRFADYRSAVLMAFDLDHDMPDDVRRRMVSEVAGEVARFVSGIRSEQDLRKLFEQGRLDGAAVVKPLRAHLEAPP